MSVYRPQYRDPKTGLKRRSDIWWYDFVLFGRRYKESTHATTKTLARAVEQRRRKELEHAAAGMPIGVAAKRTQSVREVVRDYLAGYALNHRPKSIAFVKGRLAHVTRLLGVKLVIDVTETEEVARGYVRTRQSERASGRTINAELDELARAIGRTWRLLWPKLRKLEERKDVGRALSREEETRLLETAIGSPSRIIGPFVRIALLTGMRSGEILNLTWRQIDFEMRLLTVGRSKTAAGTGRVIPMSEALYAILSGHATWFVERFGELRPEWFLFPFGANDQLDPSKPATDVKHGWQTLRRRAGISCRLHDLRHSAATRMAEAGVPESTMKAPLGHMSHAMLERYSHIRLSAKREAVEAMARIGEGGSWERPPQESPQVGRGRAVQ
jgi:integrase